MEYVEDDELKRKKEDIEHYRMKNLKTGVKVPLQIKMEEEVESKPSKSLNKTISITPSTGVTYIEKGKIIKGDQYPESLNKTFYNARTIKSRGRKINTPGKSQNIVPTVQPRTSQNNQDISILVKGNDSRIATAYLANIPSRDLIGRRRIASYGQALYKRKKMRDRSSIQMNNEKNTSFEMNAVGSNILAAMVPPKKDTKHSPSKSLLYGSKFKRLGYVSYIKSKMPKKEEERLVEW